jgi:hypothetical protein
VIALVCTLVNVCNRLSLSSSSVPRLPLGLVSFDDDSDVKLVVQHLISPLLQPVRKKLLRLYQLTQVTGHSCMFYLYTT